MKKIIPMVKRATVLAVICSVLMWSFGIGNFNLPSVRIARAAANILIYDNGLPNSTFFHNMIGPGSEPYPILAIGIWTDQALAVATSVTAVFSGDNFATSTLADLNLATSSGLTLFKDNGNGYFDADDLVVALNSPPVWADLGTTTWEIVFSDFFAPLELAENSTTTLYLAIRTSAFAADGVTISASIPVDGIVSTAGMGPAAQFHSAPYTVDAVGPTITAVEMVNNNTVDVIFSEMITMAGNPAYYGFSGGLTVIESMKYGPNIVRVRADGDIILNATTLTATADITDMAGNQNTTLVPVTVTSSARIKISEFSAKMHDMNMAQFIELYNAGSTGVDVSGWRIQYSPPENGNTWTNLAVLPAATVIPSGGFYLLGTSEFNSFSQIQSDFIFTAGFYNSGGHIRIFDSANAREVDKVGWGSAVNPEGIPASPLQLYYSLERKAFGASLAADLAPGGMHENMGNGWDTGDNSFDLVLQAMPFPQSSVSGPEMPSYSGGENGDGPIIMHMPVIFAPIVSGLDVFARMGDPMTPLSEINARLYYMIGNGTPANNLAEDYTVLIGEHQASGIFKFTVPLAAISGSTSYGLYYFLKVSTLSGSDKYMSVNSEADTSGNIDMVAQSPFITACGAPGNLYNISGSIDLYATSSNAGVLVFLEGTGYSTTTSETGEFTIEAPNGIYNLAIFKTGYYDEWINNVFVNSANIDLAAKIMYPGNSGGIAGDSNNPTINWHMPKNGDANMPTDDNFRIVASFSKAMDESTISSSTVILTAGDINSPVNGYSFAYNPVREPWMPPVSADPYILVIYPPAGGLAPATNYYTVLTGNMRDTSGNPLQGNRTTGGHEFHFSTSFDGFSYGSGGNMPPFVMDIKPHRGAIEVPINSKIALTFSEMMDKNTALNGDYLKLYKVDNNGIEIIPAVSSSFAIDTSGKTIILSPLIHMSAGQRYRVTALEGLRSAAGICMGAGCGTYEVYRSSFVTGETTDTGAPAVLGSWPADGDSGVPVNPGVFNVQFSKNLDPASVNSNTVTLKRGTTLVSSEVRYDSGGQSVSIAPKNILANSANYTLTLTGSSTSGIRDMAGNMMSTSYTATFSTTASTDTTAPEIMYANGDDFGLAVTFNEPMRATGMTDAANWPYSVLNPANYSLKWGDPVTVASAGAVIGLVAVGIQLTYDLYNNTVLINNLGLDPDLVAGNDYHIDMGAGLATDLSGNLIASSSRKTFQTPINLSTVTQGLLGPGDMMEPEMSSMGMMMAGVFPMNSLAGQNTTYFINLPVSGAIPVGGKIMITFPQGFDISSAVKDDHSPINNDINGWNEGAVTIAAVTANSADRTVIVTTGGAATQANDFLHMNISGIVNSSIPRGYDTSGYNADIKTLDSSGNLIQNISTMPFFISAAGANSLVVSAAGIDEADVDGVDDELYIFLGSPMTGPMQKIINLSGAGTGSTTFSGLPEGQYYIFTEPMASLDGGDYAGRPMPEPIMVNSGLNNKTITYVKEEAGAGRAEITVNIIGSFGTDDIDIFAGSANDFRVRTISAAGDNPSSTFYLGDGEWMIGMGPAMPKNSMSGPPPMPDWMPPAPVRVVVSGGATNDGTIVLTIPMANKHIIGYVKDASGAAIANAEVYAYQPAGAGKGANARTDTGGLFILKVADHGNYKVGAYKSGLPFVSERSIVVHNNTGVSDGNATSDVYRDNGSLITTVAPFVIRINKPAHTISGKLTDGFGAVAHAPVWANNAGGTGRVDTMTDSSGNYILFVDNGTWHVSAHIPNFGNAESRTVVVNGADETQNLAPYIATPFLTLSGTVSDGAPISYQPVRALQYNESGVYTGKEYGASTDSTGQYVISVPANNKYRVDVRTPAYGEVGLNNDEVVGSPANVIATTTNRTGLDISINTGNLRTLSFNFANAISGQEGFLNIEGVNFVDDQQPPKPNGFHYHARLSNLSATNTIQVKDGDYFMFVYVPGLGEFRPDGSSRHAEKDSVVVSADRSVDFTLIDMSAGAVTISGTVYDAAAAGGQELANAWVWIGHPFSGYRHGIQTDAAGAYSLVVPTDSGYRIGANKPGYMPGRPLSLDAIENRTQDIVLDPYGLLTVSGYVYADANSNGSYDAGEQVARGFVRAETVECSDADTSNDVDCKRSHAPVDGSGTYELGLSAGTWKIYGMSDGYRETYYGSTIVVTDSSVIGRHIKLSLDPNWSAAGRMKSIIPSSGGSLDDTAPGGTGVKLVIPPNALGNSSSAGNVNANKTSALTKTESSDPVGGQGVNITATDNSGQSINNLNDFVDIEIVLYKSDIDQAIADELLSYDKLKAVRNGYWDGTANDWVSLASTRKAYYKLVGDTEWTLYVETGTTSSAFEAFVNRLAGGSINSAIGGTLADYKLVLASKTNHFTIFAVIMPFIAQAAASTPAPDPAPLPFGGGGGGGGGGSFTSYCSSVEYGAWSECLNGLQGREVIDKSPSGCRLTVLQEADKTRDCVSDPIEEKNPETFQNSQTQIADISSIDQLYLEQGEFIYRAEITEILPVMNLERNHLGERLSRGTLTNRIGIDLNTLPSRHQYALTNFITYGSPDTFKLGYGERAGVMNSFISAFDKIPETPSDWSDIIKIANGRWPTQRSELAENRALEHFRRIYLRDPNRSNPRDDAAITVIAYGLRPSQRNTDSEKAGIKIFKAIYKHEPASALDWDLVRAISYSGSTRN